MRRFERLRHPIRKPTRSVCLVVKEESATRAAACDVGQNIVTLPPFPFSLQTGGQRGLHRLSHYHEHT